MRHDNVLKECQVAQRDRRDENAFPPANFASTNGGLSDDCFKWPRLRCQYRWASIIENTLREFNVIVWHDLASEALVWEVAK